MSLIIYRTHQIGDLKRCRVDVSYCCFFLYIGSSVDGAIADKTKYAHRFFVIAVSFYSRSVFHHHHRLPNTERHPFTLLLRQQNALIFRSITWAPRWRWRWQHCIRKQSCTKQSSWSTRRKICVFVMLSVRYWKIRNNYLLTWYCYSVIYVVEEVRSWCDM